MYQLLSKISSVFKFKNPFYNLYLEKSANSDIFFSPQNLWTGNSDNGRKITDGFLSFHNETGSFDLNTWKKIIQVNYGIKSCTVFNGLMM